MMVGGKGFKQGAGQQGGPAQKKFKGADDGAPAMAEVRYDDPSHAELAVAMLNGSTLGGGVICVEIDTTSKDNSKVTVSGVPAGCEWQEVKDHFAQCGQVAFANVKGRGKGGGTVPAIGVVRYSTADEAAQAVAMLHCSMMGESTIEVKIHGGSSDKTKVQVFGLPPATEWQELKDYFAQAGSVVFCDVEKNADGSGNARTGEVRYDDPNHAQQAIEILNGTKLGGAEIKVIKDPNSSDGSKLIVNGIPAGIEWQELKDHFSPIGTVAFANVGKGGKGKGKGKGGGFQWNPNGNMTMQQMMNMMGMGGGNFGGCFGGKNPWGGAKGGGKGGGGGGKLDGEIRYDNPLHCQFAIGMLNGSNLNGGNIKIDWDQRSMDGSKLRVTGIPAGTGWQDLKDHFASIGQVAFADVRPAGSKGKGK